MTKHKWTSEQEELLRQLYPDMLASAVAERMGISLTSVYNRAEKLGLRKSQAFLASSLAGRLDGRRGNLHHFKPGNAPWNKGIKGSTGLHPNTKANYFKPGERQGIAAERYIPLGGHRITSEGCLQRKISETGYGPRDWKSVHQRGGEEAHGHVPAGSVVVFKPGKRSTKLEAITLDVLECITRAENMRRNSVHTKYPPELARLVQLRGALNRQINKRTKESA